MITSVSLNQRLTRNRLLDCSRMRNLIHFTMAPQTDTELLAERLDAIRSEKAALMKKVEELDADEQRIKYA